MTRRDAGITLLELVVAISLFSGVALMGVQVLRLTVGFQATLAAKAAAATQLAHGLALLRADMTGSVDLAAGARPGVARLERITMNDPETPGTLSVTPVLWRLDPARRVLTRQQGGSEAPEVVVFEDVLAFEMRLLQADEVWGALPALRDAREADPADPQAPRAIEARLDTGTGPLRVLVVP